MTPATARIGTRPSRNEGYSAWADRWRRLLANCQPFRTSGALRGSRIREADGTWQYVVYSYAAVIARYTPDGGWEITDRHYSVTTSRHTNLIRRFV